VMEVYSKVSANILENRYRDAEQLIDQFIKTNPHEPAGFLFKALVIQYASTDYEDFSRKDEFISLLDYTEHLAKEKLNEKNNDLWAQYHLASAQTLKGLWLVTSQKLISGLIQARKGALSMEGILSQDSTFYDAYLMLGSYHFWESTLTRRFSWLPFFEDNRNSGITDVEKAIAQGKFTGPLSETILYEMLLEYDPNLVMRRGEKIITLYPSCRLFLWQVGEAYKKCGRFDDAERIFTRIADSMKNDPFDDGSGELRCWWKLAHLAKTVGKHDKCVYYCEKILALADRPSVAIRQKDRIEKAMVLLKDLKHE
jgi:tetratricopeptide (TPR) repeat protein